MKQFQRVQIRTIGAALGLWLCAFVVGYQLEINNSVLVVLAAAAALHAYRKVLPRTLPRRAQVWCGLYTLLLSLAVTTGRAVHYVEARSGPEENYIDWGPELLPASLALAVLLYPAVLAIFRLTLQHPLPRTGRSPRRRVWLVMWAVIFLCWTPYLLTFYPAGIVGDGAQTLELSLQSGVPSGNHWVVMYSLTLRFFLWLGSLVKADPHFGLFLFALVQSLLLSAVCAAVSYKVWRLGIPRCMAWGSMAMYAASGFFASYGMVLWKDTLFSAGVVWLVLQLWQLSGREPGLKECLNFTLTTLFLCFWRNNGLHVLILCLAALAVLWRRRGVRLLACGLAVAVFTVVVTGPVYDALKISKDSPAESLSIPIQQIGAVIASGTELTEEQQAVLYAIQPENIWRENYCPSLADDLKSGANIDGEYLSRHLGDFLRVWAELLPSHFSVYVQAYLMETLGFWQPGVFLGNYPDYWIGVQDVENRGWHSTDWPEVLTGHSLRGPLFRNTRFVASGTMVWLMLLSVTLVLAQGRDRRRRLMLLTLFVASWVILLLAVPIAYSYRYIFMLPVGLPLLCALPFATADSGEPAQPSLSI